MRPSGKNGNGKANASNRGIGSNGGSNGNDGQTTKSPTRPANGSGNGHAQTAKSNGSAAAGSGDDLDARILGMQKAVGTALFRGILREYGRANQRGRSHRLAVLVQVNPNGLDIVEIPA